MSKRLSGFALCLALLGFAILVEESALRVGAIGHSAIELGAAPCFLETVASAAAVAPSPSDDRAQTSLREGGRDLAGLEGTTGRRSRAVRSEEALRLSEPSLADGLARLARPGARSSSARKPVSLRV